MIDRMENELDKKFKALANSNRRKILLYLKDNQKCAGDIAGQISLSMASVSYHLSVLKNAQIISSNQKGGYIFYQLQHKEIEELLEWLTTLFA
ncbi:DNA-binding transcriptional ArsR family regulator [Blautia caecimuris]|uniref:DNA-binding transcriptional ArsR family regulator n=1 Tax=Blautia caecimuris TaxID=1796615 RepID=A0ABV2M771_9FIRM|nr:metalloregulator ArsR/SmtB family transcription factor [Blautia caecimuris]MDY4670962.1 metalloregulator ArsR/SmtB family transcription factor [Oliverpabstia sp.]